MTPARQHSRWSRRGLLGASAATAAIAVAATPAHAASGQHRHRWRGAPGSSGVSLRWLGTNAWEITFAGKTILVDPWLTRFKTGAFTPEGARDDTPLTIDPSTIDRYVTRADVILVCHGHYDHIADVPYLAPKTGATVLGTESHHNMLRALGTPATQLSTVRGGELLQFDGFTIEVIPSLHSMSGTHKQVPYPGTRPAAIPPRPRTIADLVEGETLAYEITIGDRFRIVALSTANFIERELTGRRPDLAIVAAGGGALHDYAGRLMRTLDNPTWVLPTHWDDMDHPLDAPAVDWGGLQPLRTAVADASPSTTFITVDHLQTFTP